MSEPETTFPLWNGPDETEEGARLAAGSDQAEVTPDRAESQNLAAFLSGGGRIGVVISGDPAVASGVLIEAAAAIPGHLFRVANPLITPLSMTRIIVQVGAEDDGGDDADILRAHLVQHATQERPAILMVENADTLDDGALSAIALFATAVDPLPVVLLLAGSQVFYRGLPEPARTAFHDPATTLTLILDQADTVEPARRVMQQQPAASLEQAVPPPPPWLERPVHPNSAGAAPASLRAVPLPIVMEPVQTQYRDGAEQRDIARTDRPSVQDIDPHARRRQVTLAIAALLLVGGLASAYVMQWHAAPAAFIEPPTREVPQSQTVPPPPPVVAPPLTGPAVSDPSVFRPYTAPPTVTELPGSVPLPPQILPPGKDEMQLRAEFLAFLTRTGRATYARDPAQFELLFRDYLIWRAKPTR